MKMDLMPKMRCQARQRDRMRGMRGVNIRFGLAVAREITGLLALSFWLSGWLFFAPILL